MNLHEAWGKRVKVTFTDGQTLSGTAHDYASRLDNPEGKASLCIENTIFFEDEVKNIEPIID